MVKTLQETMTLRTSDCDLNGVWRLSAVMTEMQDIATRHSELMGCGREALMAENLAWVVSGCRIDMDRYPRIGESLSVETFHMPARHRFFPRFFVFTGADGRPVGRASTLWLLMDLETRRSVPGTQVAERMPDNRDLTAPLPWPGGVSRMEGEPEHLACVPRYADLDTNGHVNNTRYADWLCNALGTARMKAGQIETLTLQYRAEIREDQPLDLQTVVKGETFRFSVCRGDQVFFEAEGRLSPRHDQEKHA